MTPAPRPVTGLPRAERRPGATTGSPFAPQAVRTREQWAALADRMLLAVRPYASPRHALVTLPGEPGGYGTAVDGLEGFARTFLLAGFRLAGEGGADPLGLAERYAEGLAAGTDPSSPERWTRVDEHGQAKVEAASLALILDLTRPWIWDRLDDAVQQRVVEYLAPVVGDDGYPRTNWLWFRVVVQTFLRSVGGPWSAQDVADDLGRHDSFYRADGWYSDGDGRGFDHYIGWAMHLYPVLWARMQGAADLAAGRQASDVARLDRFLLDAVHLVGADGGPLVQGRSLTYRFAAAAPFWAGAIAGVPSTSPGRLRRAASSVVGHFVERGAPDADGLLTLGWHHAWRPLVQRYSGTGSPYWAAKGMLGLALPADHPAWTDPEEPLPVEQDDSLLAVAAPGWVVSGTRADGIVRVVNHGTDHARVGADTGDSPLYARLAYSTATAPLLDDAAWASPLDQAVVLLDADGRATHRTGMQLLGVGVAGSGPSTGGDDRVRVGSASSRAQVRWIDVEPSVEAHGSGFAGTSVPAGSVRTASLVRGAWEVRAVRVESLAQDGRAVALRCGGWALAGEAETCGVGTRDAGTRDAETRDAETCDAGTCDAGTCDAETCDAETRGAATRGGDGGGREDSPREDAVGVVVRAGGATSALVELVPLALDAGDVGGPAAGPATDLGGPAASPAGDRAAASGGVHVARDASPLGAVATVPWLTAPVVPGPWWVVAVGLLGPRPDGTGAATEPPRAGLHGDRLTVHWPDGATTVHDL